MRTLRQVLLISSTLMASSLATAESRDYINIVGSSTVYPFATVVAEKFGKSSKFKTPKIESTGSGGGLKLFCAGVGVEHPDITNASRRIKQSEVDQCIANGVKEIIEVKIGYDGIAIANSKKGQQIGLSRKQIFMALAKEVPDPKNPESGKLVPNPYTTWQQIDPALPANKIEVLGPPPTSGTRDAFVELAMEGGCQQFASIKQLKKTDKNEFKRVCHSVREDGAFIEAGENDNLIVQKLEANPKAFGIFGYSFLDQNSDKVQGTQIDGVLPDFDEIAEGRYPVSRPLYYYMKKAHVKLIPGMQEYAQEFASDRAAGEEGYLSDRGLIPMPMNEQKSYRKAVDNLEPLPAKL